MLKRCRNEESDSARCIARRHMLSKECPKPSACSPERQNSDAARRNLGVMLEEEEEPGRSTAAYTSAPAQERFCIRCDMSRRQGAAVLFEVHACSQEPACTHTHSGIEGSVSFRSACGAGARWNGL